jgi:hypothetical protein
MRAPDKLETQLAAQIRTFGLIKVKKVPKRFVMLERQTRVRKSMKKPLNSIKSKNKINDEKDNV